MRALILLPLIACTSTPPLGDAAPTTVRDHLATPTRLLVSATQSTGSITASHYTTDGWQSGSIAIAIADGELDATVDATGQLQISTFSLHVDPIDIPMDSFGTAAQLRDVQLALATTTAATTTWSDDNDATATATFELDLNWSIEVGDNVLQLGTQHLPPIPTTLALFGDGDHVATTLQLTGAGS